MIRNRDEHMAQRGDGRREVTTLAEHRRLLKLPSSEQQDFPDLQQAEEKTQRGVHTEPGLVHSLISCS